MLNNRIRDGSAMSPVLNLGITTFIFAWLSTFSHAKWSHIRFQKRTAPNFSLQHLKWRMKNAIPHLVLFFIATVERNIPLTGFNSFCINTIRSNPFLSPASRMITRSQNHSSHRWKKEELYRKDHPSDRAFQASVASYIEFYNTKRPHRTLKNLTPCQMEESCCATVKWDIRVRIA